MGKCVGEGVRRCFYDTCFLPRVKKDEPIEYEGNQ